MKYKRFSPHGFTLLEVVIASSILVVIMVACMDFINRFAQYTSVDTTQTQLEWRLQYALDDLVLDLKETSPDKVDTYDFNDGPGNVSQTAIAFPTARRSSDDQFVYTEDGAVQSEPVWQGIVVYAFYSETSGQPGYLCKYVDYKTSRNYDNISISSITSSKIILSDGTNIARDLKGVSGNQKGLRLTGDFSRLVRDPEPPTALSLPLTVKLMAQKTVEELSGSVVSAQSSTGVMSRNEN